MSCARLLLSLGAVGAAALLPDSAPGAELNAKLNESSLPSWGMELRVGPYAPQVGAGIEQSYYDKFFAEAHADAMFDHGPVLATLEFDWYLHRAFGLLGVLARAGYWSVSGNTRVCTGSDGTAIVCTAGNFASSTPGTSTTSISIVPVSVAGIYRMDLLKRRLSVPLVLHAKAGIDYHFWWISAGSERARLGTRSRPALGGTLGYSVSLGAALNLDWIEPGTATRARHDSGMVGSYLLVETTRIVGGGLGNSKRFDMSDTMVTVAVGVDFI